MRPSPRCDGPQVLVDYARDLVRACRYWLTPEGREAMLYPDSAEDCAARAWSAGRQALALRWARALEAQAAAMREALLAVRGEVTEQAEDDEDRGSPGTLDRWRRQIRFCDEGLDPGAGAAMLERLREVEEMLRRNEGRVKAIVDGHMLEQQGLDREALRLARDALVGLHNCGHGAWTSDDDEALAAVESRLNVAYVDDGSL